MLTIKFNNHNQYSRFTLEGNIDSSTSKQLDEQIKNVPAENIFVLFDLEKTGFISSAGLRVFVSLEKKLKASGGGIILLNINSSIEQVLDISGLLSLFKVARNENEIEDIINKISIDTNVEIFQIDEIKYEIKGTLEDKSKILFWKNEGNKLLNVSLEELGYSSGFGCFAENRKEAEEKSGEFFSTKNFFGFNPYDKNLPSDFFVAEKSSGVNIYLKYAFGLKENPSFFITSDKGKFKQTIEHTIDIIFEKTKILPKIIFLLFTANSENTPLAGSVLIINKNYYGENKPLLFDLNFNTEIKNYLIQYRFYSVDKLYNSSTENVEQYFKDNLLFENINEMISLPGDFNINSFNCWISCSEKLILANENRLQIEIENKNIDEIEDFPDEWETIIRHIYSDSKRIILKQLTGGYSAKTFQVTGYDFEGKRVSPTVLKIGPHAMITRESNNCIEYAQKYIRNNSTSIMGSYFYKNFGGLRYSFVGITGTESKLKWLATVYSENKTEDLFPVFDKLFTNILKPWYGQPKMETIFPYKDHDPRFPFFANVIQDAEKFLNVSADEKYIDCPELNRKLINPYWFLKYEFERRKDWSFDWYTSICHGDLNMKNILLDEKENFYIIDFSETQPKNITADFARLEPVCKIEMTNTSTKENIKYLLQFEEALHKVNSLKDKPEFVYNGNDPEVRKAYEIVCRLRNYAKTVIIFEDNIIPYYLAVLEWTLPYVSYQLDNDLVRYYAVMSSALICENILRIEEKK